MNAFWNANVENKQLKLFKKPTEHLKETSDTGPKFVNLDVDSFKVIVLSDALFANASGLESQFGLVLFMIDDQNHANIVRHKSSRYHSVSQAVMVAEVHALVFVLDHVHMVCETPEELLGRQITLDAFVDS